MAGPKVMKEDVMNACEGMLQKQLYVVFTTPTDGLGPVMENVGPHLEYQVSLEERGIMFGAGPFWNDDETEWMGEGMVIVRAGSLAEGEGDRRRRPDACLRRALLHRASVADERGHGDGEDPLFPTARAR